MAWAEQLKIPEKYNFFGGLIFKSVFLQEVVFDVSQTKTKLTMHQKIIFINVLTRAHGISDVDQD